MANFIDSQVKGIYADTINKLRQDIGRNVVVIGTATTRDCPNCGYDPVKKISNGRYDPDDPYPSGITGPTDFVTAGLRHCPVCGGKGTLITAANRRNILCLISALSAQEADATPLGKNYRRNYELSASIDAEQYFKVADTIVVDGQVCKVVAIIPAGIGDLTQVTVYAGG